MKLAKNIAVIGLLISAGFLVYLNLTPKESNVIAPTLPNNMTSSINNEVNYQVTFTFDRSVYAYYIGLDAVPDNVDDFTRKDINSKSLTIDLSSYEEGDVLNFATANRYNTISKTVTITIDNTGPDVGSIGDIVIPVQDLDLFDIYDYIVTDSDDYDVEVEYFDAVCDTGTKLTGNAYRDTLLIENSAVCVNVNVTDEADNTTTVTTVLTGDYTYKPVVTSNHTLYYSSEASRALQFTSDLGMLYYYVSNTSSGDDIGLFGLFSTAQLSVELGTLVDSLVENGDIVEGDTIYVQFASSYGVLTDEFSLTIDNTAPVFDEIFDLEITPSQVADFDIMSYVNVTDETSTVTLTTLYYAETCTSGRFNSLEEAMDYLTYFNKTVCVQHVAQDEAYNTTTVEVKYKSVTSSVPKIVDFDYTYVNNDVITSISFQTNVLIEGYYIGYDSFFDETTIWTQSGLNGSIFNDIDISSYLEDDVINIAVITIDGYISATYSFVIDKTAPVIDPIDPINLYLDEIDSFNPSSYLSINDNYFVQDVVLEVYQDSCSGDLLSNLNVGLNYIKTTGNSICLKYTATDLAANSSSVEAIVSSVVDAPIIDGLDFSYINNTDTTTIDLTSSVTVSEYYLSDTPFSGTYTHTGIDSLTLTIDITGFNNGDTVYFVASNASGIDSVEIQFIIDIEPPTIEDIVDTNVYLDLVSEFDPISLLDANDVLSSVSNVVLTYHISTCDNPSLASLDLAKQFLNTVGNELCVRYNVFDEANNVSSLDVVFTSVPKLANISNITFDYINNEIYTEITVNTTARVTAYNIDTALPPADVADFTDTTIDTRTFVVDISTFNHGDEIYLVVANANGELSEVVTFTIDSVAPIVDEIPDVSLYLTSISKLDPLSYINATDDVSEVTVSNMTYHSGSNCDVSQLSNFNAAKSHLSTLGNSICIRYYVQDEALNETIIDAVFTSVDTISINNLGYSYINNSTNPSITITTTVEAVAYNVDTTDAPADPTAFTVTGINETSITIDISSFSNGETVKIYVADIEDNISLPLVFTIDNVAPVITAIPDTDIYLDDISSFNPYSYLEVVDAISNVETEVTYHSGTDCSTNVLTNLTAAKNHLKTQGNKLCIRFTSTDEASNISTTDAIFTSIDAVQINDLGFTRINNITNGTISITTSAPISAYNIDTNDAPSDVSAFTVTGINTSNQTIDISGFNDGDIVKLVVADLNNVTSNVVTFTIDNSGPSDTLFSVNDQLGPITDSSTTMYSVDFTCLISTDIALAYYSIDAVGSNPITCGSTESVTSNGVYVITLEDLIGNTTTFTFTINNSSRVTIDSGMPVADVDTDFTVTASDNITDYCILSSSDTDFNNCTWTSASGTTDVDVDISGLISGDYNLFVRSSVTNISIAYTFTVTLSVDTTGPDISLVVVTDNGANTLTSGDTTTFTDVTIDCTIDGDIDNAYYTIDGTNQTTLVCGTPQSVSADGVYVVTLEDALGNPTEFTFTIDTTGPEATLFDVNDQLGPITDSSTTMYSVDFTCSISTDIALAYYSIDAVGSNPITCGSIESVTSNGVYVITLEDSIGNTTTFTFTIDNSSRVTIDSGMPVADVDTDFTVTASDNITDYCILSSSDTDFNNCTWTSASGTTDVDVDISGLISGDYNLFVRSSVTNISIAYTFTVTLSVDTTGPDISLVVVTDNGANTLTSGDTTTLTEVTIDCTIDGDIDNAYYTIDGANQTTLVCGTPQSVSADGVYVVTLEDALGNPTEFTFTIDTTGPEATLFDVNDQLGPITDSSTTMYSVDFTCLISTDIALAYYSIDAVGSNPITCGSIESVTSNGVYVITLEDSIGNTTTFTFTINNSSRVTIDSGMPVADVDTDFTVTASDNITDYCILSSSDTDFNNCTWTSASGTTDVDVDISGLISGDYNLFVRSSVTNISIAYTFTVTMSVDTTGPDISLVVVTDNGANTLTSGDTTTLTDVTIDCTIDGDIDNAYYTIDGTNQTTLVCGTPQSVSADGVYVVTLEDALGNPTEFTFTIDSTIRSTIDSGMPVAKINDDFTVTASDNITNYCILVSSDTDYNNCSWTTALDSTSVDVSISGLTSGDYNLFVQSSITNISVAYSFTVDIDEPYNTEILFDFSYSGDEPVYDSVNDEVTFTSGDIVNSITVTFNEDIQELVGQICLSAYIGLDDQGTLISASYACATSITDTNKIVFIPMSDPYKVLTTGGTFTYVLSADSILDIVGNSNLELMITIDFITA